MPGLSDIDTAKLQALMSLERPRVCELVAVTWLAPTGTVYYAASQYDELPGYEALAARDLVIEARFAGERFQDLPFSSGLGDESVNLDFADVDGRLRTLFAQHGEGLRVEAFYYFPEVDLLLSTWFGHLRPPENADAFTFKAKASAGFRSAQLPLPRRAFYRGCQAVFGGKLTSLEVIARNDCWYNRHLGGDIGNLDADGQPFTDCPRHNTAVCIERLEPPGATRAPQFLAFDTVIDSLINRQTKGSTLYAISRGNESNLKRPLRVIFGHRKLRELDLLAYTPQYNNNHPDQGFVRVLYAISEGRIRAIWECRVNDKLIGFEHLNTRNGALRQPPTSFSPNVSNYSGTALFFGVYGQVNAANYNAGNLSGSCQVLGLDNIRVYSSLATFTEELTTNRAWCLLEVLRNRRWGYGLDDARFHLQDWIDLAEWCDETVGYQDPQGNQYASTRSTFNAELIERTAQQQVNDICSAGRFGLPFQQDGKLRVVPLRALTPEELDEAPLFTDEGPERNIVFSGKPERSSLTYSQKSDAELPNRVVASFEEAANDFVERSLTFEDIDAQLRAGRAFGDHTQRVVEKKYQLLGVTGYGEAVRLGNLLLDLGEFDGGGLKNNLSVKFTGWFKDAVKLHRYKVIRVVSAVIAPFGFEYFRVQTIKRKGDLKVEITAQAYPVDYYAQIEDVLVPPPRPGPGAVVTIGDRRGARPLPIDFETITFNSDHLLLKLTPGGV